MLSLITTGKSKLQQYQLDSYKKQKDNCKKIYSPSWTQIQSEIENRLLEVQQYQEAVSQHPSELFVALPQNPEYKALISQYFEKISQLQTQLDQLTKLAETQSIASKEGLEQYEKLLKEGTSKLKENADETFQQLTQHMSDLLLCFANVLLENREDKGSFPLLFIEIKIAVLMDSMGLEAQSNEQPPATLADKLKSILASKNLPKPCSDQLIDTFTKITFSPQHTPLVLSALNETIERVSEPAQTRANRIINPRLAPTVCIATLTQELGDQFYLANFSAVFTSFINTNRSNQELSAAILARLTALTAIAPQCSALQTLISDCRHRIDNLQSNTINDPTLDDYIELTTQLTTLKNDLETGNFFKAVKTKVVNYLTTLQNNLNNQNLKDRRIIGSVLEKRDKDRQLAEKIYLYFFPNSNNTLKEMNLLKKRINNYSEQTKLSQIINFGEINEREINAIYTPMQIEVAEYRFVLTILKGTTSNEENFILMDISNPQTRSERIKKLTDKLFFFLSNENLLDQYHHLNKLQQFFKVKEDPQQRSSAFLLFKKELRQAMTEKSVESLKILYSTNDSLGKICALFREFKNIDRLPLLATVEAEAWFDVTNNTINAFIQCTEDIDSKKNNYALTFFLKGDESKQLFIAELKETLERLPLNTTQQELEKIFEEWENKYKSIIDIPRYRPILAQLMEIFHRIQTLFSGKVFATETRTLVNRLKKQAVEATSSITNENFSPTMRSL